MEGLLASILIVNYNGAAHLPACLEALALQTLPRWQFEVILVDNASDDSSRVLLQAYPWVRLVLAPTNLGFTGGNNLAATFARATNLILLNHDTVADPHWLEELLRVATDFPAASVVSKLVFHNDPQRIQSAGLLVLRDGRGADYGFRAKDLGQFEETRPVFAGCGAALLVRRSVAGSPLFRAEFFLYYEDTELGWRNLRAGHPTIYAPRAVVRHVHGATRHDRLPFFYFHVERNRALTSVLHGDTWLALLAGPSLILRTLRATLHAILNRGQGPTAVAYWKALASFCWHLPRAISHRFIR